MTPVRAGVFVCFVRSSARRNSRSGRFIRAAPVVARQVFVRLRGAEPPPPPTRSARHSTPTAFRQVGGASGPLLYHSRSQSSAQLLTSLAIRADLQYAGARLRSFNPLPTPNDSAYSQQWSLNQIGAPTALGLFSTGACRRGHRPSSIRA